MNITRFTRMLAVTATIFTLAGPMDAAQVTFSATAPTPGTNDIANLTGATTEMDNVNHGDHDAIYIADDRPVPGQTFTTGTNSAGYQLRAVTLREVKHYTFALVPDLKYTLRVTKPSENTLEVIKTETAEAVATALGNFPSIGDGAEMGRGSGAFITLTLDRPVTLHPNTTYGFDVGGGSVRHYWQTDGTVANAYAGGEAYSSGAAGVGSNTRTARTGDHVFVATLTPASAPAASEAKASPEIKSANK